MRFWFGALVISLSWGCGVPVDTTTIHTGHQQDTSGPDTEGPVITQDSPVTDPQPLNTDILIAAHATDNTGGANGVVALDIYFQQETAAEWELRAMQRVGGDLWQGTIPAADIGSGSMRYYLVGIDQFENQGCDPTKCDVDPYRFPVSH